MKFGFGTAEHARSAAIERTQYEGIPGDLIMLPSDIGWHGRRKHMARLLNPGTREELLPSLTDTKLVASAAPCRFGRT